MERLAGRDLSVAHRTAVSPTSAKRPVEFSPYALVIL